MLPLLAIAVVGSACKLLGGFVIDYIISFVVMYTHHVHSLLIQLKQEFHEIRIMNHSVLTIESQPFLEVFQPLAFLPTED